MVRFRGQDATLKNGNNVWSLSLDLHDESKDRSWAKRGTANKLKILTLVESENHEAHDTLYFDFGTCVVYHSALSLPDLLTAYSWTAFKVQKSEPGDMVFGNEECI